MNNRLTVSPLSFSLLLTVLILFTTPAISEGINCQGSFQCFPLTDNPLKQVVDSINSIDPNRFYQNGEQIACQGFICAFLQKSGGAPGSSILTLAQDLQNHGCTQCGSVPLFFPQGDNDVANGELTINAVTNINCPGSASTGTGLC